MKRTGRIMTAGLVAAAAVVAMSGCSTVGEGAGTDAGAAGGASDGKFRIVTVSKIEGITWFQRMSEGVDMFNEANSSEVEAYQTGPNSDDPAAQVQIVEDLISQKVDAIIVVPNDPAGIGPTLKKARDAGIIVGVTEATKLVGTGSVDFDIEAFENDTFGTGFGKGLADAMGCKGKYATSVGNLTSESHILWLEAANKYIAENCPSMVNVSPTPFENFNDDKRGRELADEILAANPDLGGYLATTPSGVSGMASALRDKNITNIANVGLTLPSVAGPDLEDGFVTYGQGWDPAGWGWALNQVALNMLKGEQPATGQDLKWPLGGYGDIKVDGELILGNDIQEYRKGQFNGEYPF